MDQNHEAYPLQSAFDEVTRDMPRKLLERMLDEKLQAVPEARRRAFVEALSTHIMDGGGDVFEWDDGGPDLDLDLNVALRFTATDEERFQDMMAELGKQMPEMIGKMSDETAELVLQTLHKCWPREERTQRRDERGFCKRLDERWGKAFSALRMLLTMCREMGASAAVRGGPPQTTTLRDVLLRSHARGCQIAGEILTLMESGYADGAMARWRTLYEVGVVAMLIADWGDAAARSFLDHEIVESKIALETYEACAPAIGHERPDPAERAALMARYDEVVGRYGKDFASNYGWAGAFCGNARPNFTHLEKLAQTVSMKWFYKMASYNVHAGAKGILFKLGVAGQDVMLAGASNAGFADPCDRTVTDLVKLTVLLFLGDMKFDDLVAMKCIITVRDQCAEEAMAAHEKLEEDEARIARGT